MRALNRTLAFVLLLLAASPPLAGKAADDGSAAPEARWVDEAGTDVTCWSTDALPSPDAQWQVVAGHFSYTVLVKGKPTPGEGQFARLIPGGPRPTPAQIWALFNDWSQPARLVYGIKSALWAPDSHVFVAFCLSMKSPLSGLKLYAIPVSTGLPVLLTPDRYFDGSLSWSADGALQVAEYKDFFAWRDDQGAHTGQTKKVFLDIDQLIADTSQP